jgi:hypothetical protein
MNWPFVKEEHLCRLDLISFQVYGDASYAPLLAKWNKITNPFDRSLASTYTKKIVKPGVRYIRNSKYPFTSSLDPTKFASFDDYFESNEINDK